MDSPFSIKEFVIAGQYIRSNRGTSGNDDDPTKLHVRQYIPKSNPHPLPGDATIIATHSSAVTKEVYEPLFAEVLACTDTHVNPASPPLSNPSSSSKFRIKSIWIADVSFMGHSATINAQNLGNKSNQLDHARDLLLMINTFRAEMPQPILGLGHSAGTLQLTLLSFMHPRLFTALAYVEPVISDRPVPSHAALRRAAALKRDFWPTRAAAENHVRRSPFFQGWDERCRRLFVEHAFVETPNMLFPDMQGWTLRTPKHQEGFMTGATPAGYILPETVEAFRLLPYLQPPVLIVSARDSSLTNEERRRRLLTVTGTALSVGGDDEGKGAAGGGNGGVAAGNVEEKMLPGSHFVVFEDPKGVAKTVEEFMRRKTARWMQEEAQWRRGWEKLSVRDRQVLPESFLQREKAEADKEREAAVRERSKAKL